MRDAGRGKESPRALHFPQRHVGTGGDDGLGQRTEQKAGCLPGTLSHELSASQHMLWILRRS